MTRRTRTDERGFTLTELVVTVTILGLIAVPLCLSLAQAIKIAPESNARADRAGDRQFLADSFATDTSRAVSVTLYKLTDQTPADVSSGSATIPIPCADTHGAKKLFSLSIASLVYPDEDATPGNDYVYGQHDVLYSIQIDPIAGQAAASVNINRTENGLLRPVTVGYCSTGPIDPVVQTTTATKSCALACSLQHQSIDMSLKIKPQPQDPVEQVEFEGAIAKSAGIAPP